MAMGKNDRGSIAFFGTYRPPMPLDLFSCPANPPPSSSMDELPLTDGKSYNQNGQPIPGAALKELLTFLGKKNPKLASECGAKPEDVDKGLVTGLVFVSERDCGLETLQVALLSTGVVKKVLSLGDIYGVDTFGGVRMEDSGCIAGGFTEGGATIGHSLVYVSTKEPVKARRTPWTVVYKTTLADGKTERLTPPGEYDLSPAVSPSGKLVAVANFQHNSWNGEIEKLKTDILIMSVDRRMLGPLRRKHLIKDGGWPTWGSDTVIFFHRGFDTPPSNTPKWAVFRYDMATGKEQRVTPEDIDAMTPAAISETKVAVATIRHKQLLMKEEREVTEYRHIEIFDTATPGQPPVMITRITNPYRDHYNPFVLDGGRRIGYHRCRSHKTILQVGGASSETQSTRVLRRFDKVQPPESLGDVGLYRVSGVFPSISKNGKKLAFVDNEFKNVFLADSDKRCLKVVYTVKCSTNSIFATSWNQNDELDTLYVCEGPAFTIDKPVQIMRITNVSSDKVEVLPLTEDKYNCAFPSTNAEGTKLVFRSGRDIKGGERKDKNLYIIDAVTGHTSGVHKLTDGPWTDTHCSWSPREGCDWIVFSSSGRPEKDVVKPDPEELDHGLDPGYFAVYLVSAKGVEKGEVPVPVRVIHSAPTIAGHVNHPVFSPDMRSIVFTSDLAAVSADPISMPHFIHSVRPYGDIFSVDLRDNKDDIAKNRDIQEFIRITHSRYEYSTPTWAPSTDDDDDPNAKWKMLESVVPDDLTLRCPYMQGEAGDKESWHMTGHLIMQNRRC